ncbi:MAG: hypothetical protein F6J93_15605 [Oscillatoria sp. SIO1A7]|nr:hypothetical protein [Oscillatoria sp. SIO1A7]
MLLVSGVISDPRANNPFRSIVMGWGDRHSLHRFWSDKGGVQGIELMSRSCLRWRAILL